jgi:hypothetical protein
MTLKIPTVNEENPSSARHLCGDALLDPKRHWKGLPSATRMQMVRYIYPVENSQGKWNKINDSDNSKDWKSDRYLRYLIDATKIPLTHTRHKQHTLHP